MTHSGDPWTLSGMKANNAPHEAPVRGFLTDLVQNAPAHARFMNMLSMLEHIGSRKIMMTQMNRMEALDEDTLKHLAEEARHAYFFKRQAERIAGKSLDGWTNENTAARNAGFMYFSRLDAGITKKLVEHGVADNAAYPWVSLIVELRACWLYHIYHVVLDESDVTLSLKSLLAEEDMHLAEMFEMVGENTELLQQLSAYETELFAKVWRAIEADTALETRHQIAAE